MAGEKDQPKPVIENDVCVADPGRPQTKTQFINYSLKELKQMLDGTNPGLIEETGRNWGKVNEILSGGEGGGIAGLLDKSVDNVLEHWEGEAAQAFEREARKIARSIRNAAWHADLNSSQMADAASQLRRFKAQLDEIEEPSGWAKLGDALSDWKWDNGEAVASDLQDRKLTAKEVAEINEGKIGASREAQLNGVAVMENLGAQYMRISGNLQRNRLRDPGDGHVGEPNRDVDYPPPVTPGGVGASRPGASGGTPKPWSAGATTSVKPAPNVPRDQGITGGTQLPTTKTKVDSIAPGLSGTGPGLNTGPGGPGPGGGGGTGGPQGPGIVPAGGGAGAGRGTAGRGGIGVAGGRGGMTGGGAAAGRGAGGRAGMGGMGGAGAAGAGGRGAAGAGGRGALARSRGGVVGAAKGITGKGAGGGAGLHGSRGGTQRGAMGGGMAGGLGGRNGRRSEEENRSDRPDYLVEDEETWISEEDRNRNVPRTIE